MKAFEQYEMPKGLEGPGSFLEGGQVGAFLEGTHDQCSKCLGQYLESGPGYHDELNRIHS